MSKKGKLIVTAIIILFILFVIYTVNDTSKEGSGSFDNFDINSTANKNIKVELVHEKGFTPNPEGGVTFYVKDKNGIEKKVSLGKELPSDVAKYKSVTLTGHLHADHFHATEAELD